MIGAKGVPRVVVLAHIGVVLFVDFGAKTLVQDFGEF